ncbi:glycerol ethanol, ferric requiring protein [Coemansia thaxteri]|uniref:Chloride channel protein n=1 Tax=Coemansia thaxteri TaxID=2663907 RepID=A0A9W8BHA8_9FUNG|nr:glycerol ethanol, ferric requiring protein [Coemansia thaxteri]KAJ2007687.1 glycerol ethanol, ferric requiring protein [Coemansia thaxteri]KAJ2471771.1 glycerol ethanol, ferric requiring protein [Coemansia sp. RSA 2322]KAJ2485679.1 glycerol ethanol, ferric requiring protein [Coemansia sp. RSA 2320]
MHGSSVQQSTARFDEFRTVDWMDDAAKERAHVRRQQAAESGVQTLVRQAYDAAVSVLVVVAAGALIGINTAVISIATEWLSDAKLGVCGGGWWLNRKFCCWQQQEGQCAEWRAWDRVLVGGDAGVVRWMAFVGLGTSMAAASAALVRAYAPLAAGSGLGEIKAILGGFVISGFMGARTLAMKSVGLALAAASGLSVGKEGPAVHVGTCVGSVVARRVGAIRRSAARQREVVAAAAAAGVAVAFGAPIGGVLFALEDLCARLPVRALWPAFLCALAATVSLQAMDPFRSGKLVLFHASYDRDWRFFEAPLFALLGAFGGVFGGVCIRVHLRVAAWRAAHVPARHAVREAAALALATTAVTYLNAYTRADMGAMLGALLQESTVTGAGEIAPLLAAAFIRACGTAVAYGSRVPCGIFVPSMAVGAAFGRAVGAAVVAVQAARPQWAVFAACAPDAPCVAPATYAFLGAAAALCGVTKVAVAVVVIMYELTGALDFIVPTVIAVMVARVVGDAIVDGGISEQLILRNGIPLLDQQDQVSGDLSDFEPVAVAKLMRPAAQLAVLPLRLPLPRLRALLADPLHVRGFPVVDDAMRVAGYVPRDPLARALAPLSSLDEDAAVVSFACSDGPPSALLLGLAALVNPSPVCVRPRTAAETVVDIFRNLGPQVVLVTSEEDGTLAGLLTRKDMLRHMRAAQ